MKKSILKTFLLSGMAVVILPLSGCGGIDMYEKGHLSDSRIQIKETLFSDDVSLSDANDEYLNALAYHYNKYGDGAVDLVIAYDPYSSNNTAMMATNKVADITESLREYGLSDIGARVMPVKDLGDEARLQVSYNSYNAEKPKGCDEVLPGIDGTPVEFNPHYKLGCSTQTLMAKQVAKPKHLLGRGVVDQTTDGRVATNVVELYRTGAKNEPLDGETASDSE